jgi:hypothetical protein
VHSKSYELFQPWQLKEKPTKHNKFEGSICSIAVFYRSSSYSTSNRASLFCIDSSMMSATAQNTSPCLFIACQNLMLRQPQFLNLVFTVPCHEQTLLCIAIHSSGFVKLFGHFTYMGASPIYPSSALTHLPCSKYNIRKSLKIFTSGHRPQANGPLIQTRWPNNMQRETSY